MSFPKTKASKKSGNGACDFFAKAADTRCDPLNFMERISLTKYAKTEGGTSDPMDMKEQGSKPE